MILNKGLYNFVWALFVIWIISEIVTKGAIAIKNWFIAFIHENLIWIILTLIVLVVVPILYQIISSIISNNKGSTDDNLETISPSPIVNTRKKEDEVFDHWRRESQDGRLTQTKKMIDLLNEMLKSTSHEKSYKSSYDQLLNKNGNGYVYFVTLNGRTKIGMTEGDPYNRIKKMYGGVNQAFTIQVSHLIRTDRPRQTEKAFHQYFENKRYKNPHDPNEKNEYFTLDEEDLKWVKRHEYPNSIKKTIQIAS